MNHALIFSVAQFENYRIRRMLGPHRIASYLREHDWDVEVVDWADYWTLDQLKELSLSRITSDTTFIGFSCFFGFWSDTLNQYCAWVKMRWPHIKIVWGSHSSPYYESSNIDYYIVGYGEKAMLQLVKSFTDNSIKVSFDPKFFGSKRLISAIDAYPSYPMQSLKVIYEDRDFLDSREWLTTELGRGCKFSCKFCNFPILGVKGDYTRSAEDFDLQLRDAYDRFGITHYYLADETVNETTEKLEKFAKIVDKLNFKPSVNGFIRADLLVANKDQWDPLARLGMGGQYYGIESMNWKSAKSIGKGMNPDKLMPGILEVRDWFKKYGPYYRGNISLICGLPHETEQSWDSSIQWIKDNWQGESCNLFSLDIPINEKNSKLSFISENYKTLGYRESLNPRRQEFTSNYGRNLLDWENDHMSFVKAEELVQKANSEVRSILGVNPWQYGDFILITNTIEEISILNRDSNTSPNREVELFVESYIVKKLNW